MREALQATLELEAFQLARQNRAKSVRGLSLDDKGRRTENCRNVAAATGDVSSEPPA